MSPSCTEENSSSVYTSNLWLGSHNPCHIPASFLTLANFGIAVLNKSISPPTNAKLTALIITQIIFYVSVMLGSPTCTCSLIETIFLTLKYNYYCEPWDYNVLPSVCPIRTMIAWRQVASHHVIFAITLYPDMQDPKHTHFIRPLKPAVQKSFTTF